MFIKSVLEDRTTHKHIISMDGYYKEMDSGLTELNVLVNISIQSEEELKLIRSLIGENIEVKTL